MTTYTLDKQLNELVKAIAKHESGKFDTGEFYNEIEGILKETWNRATEESIRSVFLAKREVKA